MDVFKFLNAAQPTLLDRGQIINGIKSKLWIERYRDVGEFEFVADASKGLPSLLPIGSLISHIESTDVMIVENHEINDEKGKETEIKITGRSFESFLENRIVGSNKAWPTEASANEEYILSAGYSWNQAVVLLRDHLDVNVVINVDDALPHVEIFTNVVDTGDVFLRSIKRGPLYDRLMELLVLDNLGIRVVRPGIRSPLGWSSDKMAMLIHKGRDLTKDVVFSYNNGEIESADYLWSNKRLKNAAFVTTKWFERVITNEEVGLRRRMMFVDANDLDSGWNEAPTGTDRDLILFYMLIRGIEALLAQKDVALIKTESTKNSSVHKYRQHYDLGDIVTVDAEYNEAANMRVTEYVEIEDETGQSGYPTLSAL